MNQQLQILKDLLEDVIDHLERASVFQRGSRPSSDLIQRVVGNHRAMVTVHQFGFGDFFVYVNDRKRDFYGFDKNDLSEMNVKFYFQTYHPKTYFLLAQAYQFFLRDQKRYLEATYRLRVADGFYVVTPGVSRVVTRDASGKVEYIVSVTCAESDLPMMRFREKWGDDCVTSRQKDCLSLLLQGLSNSQISGELGLSERTVEKHVQGIFTSVGVSSRRSLIEECLGQGYPAKD